MIVLQLPGPMLQSTVDAQRTRPLDRWRGMGDTVVGGTVLLEVHNMNTPLLSQLMARRLQRV